MNSPIGELATQLGTGAAFLFTSWQAWKANKQTKNTGNGFAKHTTDSLKELLAGQERLEEKTDRVEGKIDRHLEDHASSDLRR